jgi:hypothetical protein
MACQLEDVKLMERKSAVIRPAAEVDWQRQREVWRILNCSMAPQE